MTLKELLAKNEAARVQKEKNNATKPQNFENKPNNKRKGKKPANREFMVVDPELKFLEEKKVEEMPQPEEIEKPVEEKIEDQE